MGVILRRVESCNGEQAMNDDDGQFVDERPPYHGPNPEGDAYVRWVCLVLIVVAVLWGL